MSDAEPINWDHLKSRQPSEADRKALQQELVERAVAVKRDSWDEYREAWASGDIAGVAYLLQDTEMLEELGEQEGSVLMVFAGSLYGFNGARKDIEAGLVGTQAWFAEARKQLDARGSGA
ncbi:hypothetical protein GFY24_24265 [Nocardia sp. SYP-A9097]|uniref:hypothetical protein n=1 Tax=Nocardia sp. SYP-A9097 TaxID=2663237 RepID=UPI00129AAD1C|nr:hypothetical protein [Nocardia sp. SYP-A9097]MRH90521.1 hypothetical protein [Nocardia sp. SYP-A9097]